MCHITEVVERMEIKNEDITFEHTIECVYSASFDKKKQKPALNTLEKTNSDKR